VIPFDEHDEYMQGMLGIKDATHLKDPIGVALKIIEKMCEENKPALEAFYKVTIENQDSYDVLEIIGRQTNCLKKKGEIDDTRVGIRIVNDWQRGLLLI
jgi:ribosome biogenesis GTPase A